MKHHTFELRKETLQPSASVVVRLLRSTNLDRLAPEEAALSLQLPFYVNSQESAILLPREYRYAPLELFQKLDPKQGNPEHRKRTLILQLRIATGQCYYLSPFRDEGVVRCCYARLAGVEIRGQVRMVLARRLQHSHLCLQYCKGWCDNIL